MTTAESWGRGGGGGARQHPSDTAGPTLVSETMSVLSAKGRHYSFCDSVLWLRPLRAICFYQPIHRRRVGKALLTCLLPISPFPESRPSFTFTRQPLWPQTSHKVKINGYLIASNYFLSLPAPDFPQGSSDVYTHGENSSTSQPGLAEWFRKIAKHS